MSRQTRIQMCAKAADAIQKRTGCTCSRWNAHDCLMDSLGSAAPAPWQDETDKVCECSCHAAIIKFDEPVLVVADDE